MPRKPRMVNSKYRRYWGIEMTDLTDLTVRDALAGLRAGTFSSRELTSAFLQKINRLEGEINAFITLTPDLAVEKAN